jgi:NADH-quinone oxidoreductase subunit A
MATGEDIAIGLLILALGGVAVALGGLLVGAIVRRRLPHPEKDVPYECGEPTIGQAWVQFDLRFYVAALVFLIFDIEIALFWPWAVVYLAGGMAAMWDMLFFFGVIVVGFLYLWRFGYLDWVRATSLEGHAAASSPTSET